MSKSKKNRIHRITEEEYTKYLESLRSQSDDVDLRTEGQ